MLIGRVLVRIGRILMYPEVVVALIEILVLVACVLVGRVLVRIVSVLVEIVVALIRILVLVVCVLVARDSDMIAQDLMVRVLVARVLVWVRVPVMWDVLVVSAQLPPNRTCQMTWKRIWVVQRHPWRHRAHCLY